MNPHFTVVTFNNVSTLVYKPWHEEGILHGMTLSELDFSSKNAVVSTKRLSKARGLKRLVLPTQTHSDVVWRVSRVQLDATEEAEADAVVGTFSDIDAHSGVAIGVKTADCVPVIVRCKQSWCRIHAGWRGLANGIIKKAIAECQGSDEVVSAAIFAAAGRDNYEVGSEVVSAIGPSAVFQRIPDSKKVLLDVQGTAKEQILRAVPNLNEDCVAVSEVCTISNPSFHSYRRDKGLSGRNLIFIKFPR